MSIQEITIRKETVIAELKQRKEKLIQRRRKLNKEVEDIDQELFDLQELPHIKAVVGKCFKSRNCYSCPQTEKDYWTIYYRITGISDSGRSFTAVSCQYTNDDVVEFKKYTYMPTDFILDKDSRRKEISTREWNRAVSSLVAKATSFAK